VNSVANFCNSAIGTRKALCKIIHELLSSCLEEGAKMEYI
jgi:hypothetical protein